MSAMTAIPRGPEDLTATWLTAALASEAVEIDTVRVEPVGTGQTGATYRMAVSYAANPSALPDSFIAKLPAQDDEVRARVILGYRSECAFYQSVADQVAIPVPDCLHCEISEDSTEFVLLMTDQHPAVQGDQIAGCDEEQARLAVTALAGLHGPTWCQSRWQSFPGLAMSVLDQAGATGLGDIAKMSAGITVEKLGPKLDGGDHLTLLATMDVVTPWLSADRGRFSLMHGDYRLDNMLFHPDGKRLKVVDWQTLGVGLPARDLAYFAATSLDPALRNAIEADLVGDYHRALTAYGISDYDRQSCWDDYRFGMVQALMISVLGYAFAVGTDRGDDMVATMIQRGCRAVRDLDTLDLVARSAR